jgi:GNAT superfamily N-acetyltransferase
VIDLRVAVEVNIRPATWADLELLVRWNSSVDRVVAPTLCRQERSEALVLLAVIGPWPVGHLLVDFVALQPEGATHLWYMGVHDMVRNRGVGTALIQVAEREASGRGLRESALEVEKPAGGVGSRRFDRRRGCSEGDPWPTMIERAQGGVDWRPTSVGASSCQTSVLAVRPTTGKRSSNGICGPPPGWRS